MLTGAGSAQETEGAGPGAAPRAAGTCRRGSPAALFLLRYVLHSDFPLQAARVRGSALPGESDRSAQPELFIEGGGLKRRMRSASCSSAAGLRTGRGTQEQRPLQPSAQPGKAAAAGRGDSPPDTGTARWTRELPPRQPKGRSPGALPSRFPPTLTHAASRGVRATPRTGWRPQPQAPASGGGLSWAPTGRLRTALGDTADAHKTATDCGGPRELKIQRQ